MTDITPAQSPPVAALPEEPSSIKEWRSDELTGGDLLLRNLAIDYMDKLRAAASGLGAQLKLANENSATYYKNWMAAVDEAIVQAKKRISAEARADDLASENQRLKECLNHAVSELARAAYSEEFDSADCTDCIDRISDLLTPMGNTPDWHIMGKWYDRLCAAAGVDNGDEIDILPIAEKMLREHVAAGAGAGGGADC